MLPGRSYLLKLHTREVAATVTDIKYRREDIDSGAHLAVKILGMNEIAMVAGESKVPSKLCNHRGQF